MSPICWRSLVGMSYELNTKEAHKTFDILRDAKLAEEQAKLQFVLLSSAVCTSVLISYSLIGSRAPTTSIAMAAPRTASFHSKR